MFDKRFFRAIRFSVLALGLLAAFAGSLLFRTYSQTQIQTGYAVISANLFSALPVGTALFTFTNSSGILVSQAGVGAVDPISSGTVFVDQQGTSTAIAIVNPSGTDSVRVTFIVRNASGVEISRKEEVFGPGQHRPRFVSELFPSLPANFVGSLSFSTVLPSQKVAAITLRQNTNIEGEPVFATLPVLDLSAPASTQPVVLPHLGAGPGLSTQLVLISRSAQRSVGRINFFASDGTPLRLQISGTNSSEFPFQIEANGVFRAELTSLTGFAIGYAVVTLDQGTDTPSGSAIFQYRSTDNRLLSEAGVASTPATTDARIFVDRSNTQTGVAIANAGNGATTVTFELFDRSGISLQKVTIDLPARGHMARFAEDIFSNLPQGFVGSIEITSPVAVVAVTLKLTTNQRQHPILTTLPVADLTRALRSGILIFPQIGFGGGFSTRLILISPDKNRVVSGRVVFIQSNGNALVLPFAGQTGSEFQFRLFSAGVLQLRPGNSSPAREIVLDPSNPTTNEIVVNEGGSVPLNPLVIDSEGVLRDDFTFTFAIDATDVISLDASNTIFGQRRGYSSLIITQGTIVKTATVTVTTLTSGVAGYEITGLTQDSAQNLFLSSTPTHTVLRTINIAQPPQVFAGVNQKEGFANTDRLLSLFNGPAFLAFNAPESSIYVTDPGNQLIRRIRPGTFGQVETAAGVLGQTGALDGAAAQATFNNPQGLTLDNRGFLWIVDSGNHTIRRMNLLTRTVQTIAGKAGTSGLADGTADQARFNSPVGIAFETETIAQQLSGVVQGFVSVIVADTGNGAIRRVKDNGQVETIGGINFKQSHDDDPLNVTRLPNLSNRNAMLGLSRSGALPLSAAQSPAGDAYATSRLSFTSPTGVVADSFGNIYVSEPSVGRVKTLLRTGIVVLSAEPNSFSSPKGMLINQVGRVLVAERGRLAQEARYAAPTVTGLSKSQISTGGDRVTVMGRNFAADTLCVLGNRVLSVTLNGTTRFTITTPPLPAGTINCVVLHRGGRADIGMQVVN